MRCRIHLKKMVKLIFGALRLQKSVTLTFIRPSLQSNMSIENSNIEPLEILKQMRNHVEKMMTGDSGEDILISVFDLVESHMKLCPENAGEALDNLVKMLSGGINEIQSDKKEDLSIERTESFNNMLKQCSNISSTNDSIAEEVNFLVSFPFQHVIDRCAIEKIDYVALLQTIDRLFRYEGFGNRNLSEQETENNPRNIPKYIWDYTSGLYKPIIVLNFRTESLTPKLHKNLSALMRLYSQLKDNYEYELPAELYDHISKWLIDNDVQVKSAYKS